MLVSCFRKSSLAPPFNPAFIAGIHLYLYPPNRAALLDRALSKLIMPTNRAMILWVSQSGGDEYEYQLTV